MSSCGGIYFTIFRKTWSNTEKKTLKIQFMFKLNIYRAIHFLCQCKKVFLKEKKSILKAIAITLGFNSESKIKRTFETKMNKGLNITRGRWYFVLQENILTPSLKLQ